MNQAYVIDWVYDLPTQTLTDELKEDIIELIVNYTKSKEVNK